MRKGILLFSFLVYAVLTNGQSELDIIRERLQRLESRFVDDIALIRREFYQASNKFAKKQDVDQINNEVHAETTELSNMDFQNIEAEMENLRLNVLNQFKLFWDGLSKEKRIRRSLQHDVESLKRLENSNGDMIASGFDNITKFWETFQGNLLNSLQNNANRIEENAKGFDNMAKILENISENIENVCKNEKEEATQEKQPRVADCAEWQRLGYTSSGIYTIHPESIWRPINVFCDMETDGGGWIVFQRRSDGSEDFNRNWIDYTLGFGNLSREFWLGNEFIHRLSSNEPCELRIELKDFKNESKYAKYGLFDVGPRSGGFILSVQFFSGDVVDSLTPQDHKPQFSTLDVGPLSGCYKIFKGGWWYENCHNANLNNYYHFTDFFGNDLSLYGWHGYRESLMFSEMKLRRR